MNTHFDREAKISAYLYLILSSDLVLNEVSQKDFVKEFILNRFSYFLSNLVETVSVIEASNIIEVKNKINDLKSSGVAIVLDICNPFFDELEVERAIKACIESSAIEQNIWVDPSKSLLRGTEFVAIFNLNISANSGSIFDHTYKQLSEPSCIHHEYFTSLSITRKKSLKIFAALLEDIRFRSSALSSTLKYFSSEAGIKKVLSYGDGTLCLSEVHSCPVCFCENSHYIRTSIGYPRIGFLSNRSEYYKQCTSCSHLYLKFVPLEPSDYANYYDLADSELSYANIAEDVSKDPASESYHANFEFSVETITQIISSSTFHPSDSSPNLAILDLGCGSGGFLKMLSDSIEGRNVSLNGVDYKVTASSSLDPRVKMFSSDVFAFLELHAGKYDFIAAFEFIEHVHPGSLAELVNLIYKALKPGGIFICSTPDFDAVGSRITDFWAAYVPQHPNVFTSKSLDKLMGHQFVKIKSDYRSYPFKKYSTEIDFYSSIFRSSSSPAKHALTELLSMLYGLELSNGIQSFLPCEIIAFYAKSLK